MDRLGAWLTADHDGLGVVLAALGLLLAVAALVVAAIYARLTRNLAVAANRQAELTQALVERGYRPWLSIVSTYKRRSGTREDYPETNHIEEARCQNFSVALRNKGSVPAIITAWRVVVHRDADEQRIKQSQPGVETVVYPDATELLTEVTIEDRWNRVKRFQEDGQVVPEGGEDKREMAKIPVRLRASVTYRGVVDKPYTTEAVYNVGPETDFVLVCREVRLR